MSNLKKIGGSVKLATVQFANKTKFRYMRLLFQDDVIIAGITIQLNTSGRLYIESVDTTGFFNPRDCQTIFTKEFILETIMQFDASFISVFSCPKKEILFRKSSKNSNKGGLKTAVLLQYWIKLFESIQTYNKDMELHVFSKFYPKMSIPYRSLEEIYLFKDDPKRKLMKSIKKTNEENKIDLKSFFNIIELRSDFNHGGFVYLVNSSRKSKPKILDTIEIKSMTKMQRYLRNLDFSTLVHAKRSTKKFIKKFNIQLTYFITNSKNIKKYKKNDNENIIMLKPKKKQI
ncbi:Histone acetyltransferase [Astathelohania contejeani]|uniref:histone acetyltransferase n=1 Tax=Astathelohania contejeani TaxID=164912 RepID=A0ABQ7I2G3_9MICR|nr:Histone acetyltransferase [Thelohania contejeani]